MTITITRNLNSPFIITGVLSIINTNGITIFSCSTLELPWLSNAKKISCIPCGSYRLVKHYSRKFGRCFSIKAVPNRSHILIHVGNYKRDTLGCILVGRWLAYDDASHLYYLHSSSLTLNTLLTLLPLETNLLIT